jgi:hypothetical protein
MKRVLKNIPVIILWVAWLILTAHLLIPHDHHLVETYVNQEEPCPASHGSPNHHPLTPVHCHAFNDITFEKSVGFIHYFNQLSVGLISYNSFDPIIPDYHVQRIGLFGLNDSLPDHYLLEISSLRAPPVLY